MMRAGSILMISFLVVFSTLSGVNAGKKPNVVYILADDGGVTDIGAFRNANIYPNDNAAASKITTPNLDALAGKSMKFSNAYAAPVCAPSRCTLMTGRHLGHCTIRGNDGAYTPLTANDTTIATVMARGGYNTALFGKWGLGNFTTSGYPLEQGWQSFVGYDNQVACHDWYPAEWCSGTDGFVAIESNQDGCNTFSEDLVVNNSISYINKHAQDDDPFFLFVSYVTPHSGDCHHPTSTIPAGPYAVPTDPQYAGENWDTAMKDYATVVSRQDRDVQRIVEALAHAGILDNTFLLYQSDNGAELESNKFFNNTGPLRGYKRSLYEGGMRTAFFVSGPGVSAGTLTDHQVYTPDIMPTLVELVDLPNSVLPAEYDGHSFAPTLLGKDQPQPDFLYWEFCYKQGGKGNTSTFGYPKGWGQAVRSGDMKFMRFNFNESEMLFNVTADVSETTNLVSSYPDLVKQLSEVMNNQHVENSFWPSGVNCCASKFSPGICVPNEEEEIDLD